MRGVVLAILVPAMASAASDDAAQKVRRGIEHYHAGRYDAAASDFGEADALRPGDPRIAFDRACAYAARDDTAKAVELFQQAALAPDRRLSAGSHYNLGNVAAGEARARFGEKPEEASAAVRREGLELLASAIGHYRDCLRIEAEYGDARHNLELIRIWMNRMEQVWKERDRRQHSEDMSLLDMLEELQKRQRELRTQTKQLSAESKSPQRQAGAGKIAEAQRSLTGQLEPLKDTITWTLKSEPPADDGTAGPSPDQADRVEQALLQLVDRVGEEMTDAADALDDGEPGEASRFQAASIERLDEIYLAVVSLANLVHRALQTQEQLIQRVEPLAKLPRPGDRFDFGEAAWDQRFVARWSEILPAKAKMELAQLKRAASRPSGLGGAPSANPEIAAMKELAKTMVKAMESAIEVGPRVHDLTAVASDHLEKKESAQALPKQREALKLLEEILQSLPKQARQQAENRQQTPQPEQENQDDEDRRKPAAQDRPDREEKPPSEPQQKSQDQRPPDARKAPVAEKDVSKQEAEAMIRQVRDRQRQRRAMERQFQQRWTRPAPVEKDW